MIQNILLKLCEYEFIQDYMRCQLYPDYVTPKVDSFTYLTYWLYEN